MKSNVLLKLAGKHWITPL